MGRRIFVTSDQHFGHRNILYFQDQEGRRLRPFSSVEEMDEFMIQQWNSVVRRGDHVWQLGDFYFGKDYQDFAVRILPQLHGHISMLLGNHDKAKELGRIKRIRKIQLWRDFSEQNLLCTHVPLHESSLLRRGSFRLNVHGHIHEKESPGKHWRNVSVERTNYTPVDIESLQEELEEGTIDPN